jgi:hypothetical protein
MGSPDKFWRVVGINTNFNKKSHFSSRTLRHSQLRTLAIHHTMKPTPALVLRVAFAVGVALTLFELAIKTPRYSSVAINCYILFNSSNGKLLL